ncbi:MAG TPA: ATP-binding protein [Planktothrix sp.]|jgi:signal transduction histidine kinase/CheY-like chemotaxis protein
MDNHAPPPGLSPLKSDTNNTLIVLLQLASLGSCVFATLVGAASLIVNFFHPSDFSIDVSCLAALGFVIAGVGLLLLNKPHSDVAEQRVAKITAVSLGLVSLMGSAPGVWRGPLGIMPFQISLSFTFLAAGIFFLPRHPARSSQLSQSLALAVAFISCLALIGYGFGYPTLASWGLMNELTFPCASALLSLAMALFLARPHESIASILASDTVGGTVARRLLPACFLTPLLGLAGKMQGNQTGILLILIVLVTFGLPLLIWVVCAALQRAERDKDTAYSQVQLLNQQLNKQVDELMQSQHQLTEALQARSEFLAKVSHELRTPLSGIIGTTELLQGMQLNKDQLELAHIALDSANTLLALINEILDFSKIDARKLHLETIPFDLKQLVDTAVQSMRAKANRKQLTLLSFVTPDVPATVSGDPARIRQILVNLIDNAIKFTEDGKVLLQVAMEGDMVRFAVTDTGIGISPEGAEKLFQPFVQADGSMTRRYGGTGLGLSICKSLVDLMHGKIGVTSSHKKGSTFWFQLRLEPATIARAVEQPEASGRYKVLAPHEACVILIAEDNPVNARLAALQLKRLGFQADIATNGVYAVRAIEHKSYALILMDIQMPEMDGFEATKIIREAETNLGIHIPIIATTAHAMSGDADKCLSAGMDDYLTKPLSLPALSSMLKKWIPAKDSLPPNRSLAKIAEIAASGPPPTVPVINSDVTVRLKPPAVAEVLPLRKRGSTTGEVHESQSS